MKKDTSGKPDFQSIFPDKRDSCHDVVLSWSLCTGGMSGNRPRLPVEIYVSGVTQD